MRRALGTSLLAVALAVPGGCGGPSPSPAASPAPDRPDVGDDPSPDVAGPEAPPAGRAPPLEPPPGRAGVGLDRDQALAEARRHGDPADAIAVLDQSRFAFPLDAAALRWFGAQGLDPAVLDYLDKRSRIDWDALRGDIDPAGPGR